ncbi:MAG TPA: hypothetical protein DCM28_02860 [Phycisphaerales bacterium]|nr:hypothetical protein [Phycisphaerales bacterium]HCD33229.1 hypothetical protein [Phycisphaerales bacterium]
MTNHKTVPKLNLEETGTIFKIVAKRRNLPRWDIKPPTGCRSGRPPVDLAHLPPRLRCPARFNPKSKQRIHTMTWQTGAKPQVNQAFKPAKARLKPQHDVQLNSRMLILLTPKSFVRTTSFSHPFGGIRHHA